MHRLAFLLFVLALSACSTQQPKQAVSDAQYTRIASQSSLGRGFLAHNEKWQGTPYQWGGQSRSGVDCSAYVQQAYASVAGLSLPRTTGQQRRVGQAVSMQQVRPGDLIFFDTRSDAAKQYQLHVGVYVGEGAFSHASVSRGVTVSSLSNPYWQSRLLEARRVIR